MRKTILLFVVLFFLGTLAIAQVPTSGNVFFGYSYYNTDLPPNRGSLNGWEGSLEGKVLPLLGIVADFSGNYGTLNFKPINVTCPTTGCPTSVSTHVDNVLFGPRLSVPVGKFRPFAEVMVGIGHANASGVGTDNSFATAVGGGIDYRLFHMLGWRFEGDYMHTSLFGGSQGNVRLSTGVAIHF